MAAKNLRRQSFSSCSCCVRSVLYLVLHGGRMGDAQMLRDLFCIPSLTEQVRRATSRPVNRRLLRQAMPARWLSCALVEEEGHLVRPTHPTSPPLRRVRPFEFVVHLRHLQQTFLRRSIDFSHSIFRTGALQLLRFRDLDRSAPLPQNQILGPQSQSRSTRERSPSSDHGRARTRTSCRHVIAQEITQAARRRRHGCARVNARG